MRAFLIIAAVLLLVPGWAGEERLPLAGRAPSVAASGVALDDGDLKRRRVGALTYLGGIALASRDPGVGGYSALAVAGDRFVMLSDGGLLTRFRMGADLRPRDFAFGALPAGPGTGWTRQDRDSEAMAVDAASGRAWVAFERANMVWRYAPGFVRAEARAAPPAMAGWPKNSGAEAIVRLRRGGFLIFSEGEYLRGGGTQALAFAGDPADGAPSFAFAYLKPKGYKVTDAAELPDGRILVLHRRAALASGFTASLSIVDPRGIRPGGRVSGREIATLAAPLVHDNFEGVAVTREARATIVWLVSDDNNRGWFQRTLLLKLRLDEPAPR